MAALSIVGNFSEESYLNSLAILFTTAKLIEIHWKCLIQVYAGTVLYCILNVIARIWERGNLEQKIILSYAYHKIHLNAGSKI